MNALLATSPADTLVAGLLIGASLMLLSFGIIWLGRSMWSERQAQKAERIVFAAPVPLRRDQLPFDRPDIEAAVDHALAIGAHLNAAQSRLAVVADVVPISGAVPVQRRGGDAS